MLKSLRISSGVLPLIMFATVLQPTSLQGPARVRTILPQHPYAEKLRQDSQKGLDIEVVCRKDDLEEHLLINGNEFLVPFADVRRPLAGLVLARISICRRQRLTPVVLAVLEDLR